MLCSSSRCRARTRFHNRCDSEHGKTVLISSSASFLRLYYSSRASGTVSNTTLVDPVPSLMSTLRGNIDKGYYQLDAVQQRTAKRLQRLQDALYDYANASIIEEWLRRQQSHNELDREESMDHSLPRDERTTGDIAGPASKAASTLDLLNHDTLTTTPKYPKYPTLPATSLNTSGPPVVSRIPRGLYIHGPVGVGKSMLMDLFFDHVCVSRKRREHFHAFMGNVHQRIHELKQDDIQRYGRNFKIDTRRCMNPVHRVGIRLAEEISLLCLDEFQVTDVADALILAQLFSVLFTLGTVVVVTSNRPPSDLYQDGLHRQRYFVPFLNLLEKHCIVHAMQSYTDYRKVMAVAAPLSSEYLSTWLWSACTTNDRASTYFITDKGPNDNQIKAKIDEIVSNLRNGLPATTARLSVQFHGQNRTLVIPSADVNAMVGQFHFDDLCCHDLGAADYRTVAHHFTIIVIEDIPILTLQQHDQARRFITLIDELYEAKTPILCSAAASVEGLFVFFTEKSEKKENDMSDTNEVKEQATSFDNRVNILGMDQAIDRNGYAVCASASIHELLFAFRRAGSRLVEMTSPRWWERHFPISSGKNKSQQLETRDPQASNELAHNRVKGK